MAVEGSGGHDYIALTTSVETITAGTGDDTIEVASVASYTGDTLDGGSQTDTILITGAGSYTLGGTIDSIENVVIDGAVAANVDLSAQTEGFNITGSTVANTIAGGHGNDTIDSAGGDDTVVYTTTLSASNFSYDSGTNTWTVNASAGGEGTDALTHVEKVAGADPVGPSTGRFLLVDTLGSYTTGFKPRSMPLWTAIQFWSPPAPTPRTSISTSR